MPPPSPRKPWWRRWFGGRSERAAERYLRRLGWRLVARNYACVHGEIDLILLDGRSIVFVEVRSTEADDAEKPLASVDAEKQRRLTRLALHYLQKHRLLEQAARFDVLAVTWPAGRRDPCFVHHRLAFDAVGRFQMDS
jgi:putative endonuclease